MRMYRGRIHPHPTIVGWGVLLLLDKIIHSYVSFLKLLFWHLYLPVSVNMKNLKKCRTDTSFV